MLDVSFDHYKDPEKAKKVFAEYLTPEVLKTLVEHSAVESAVARNKTAEGLDFALDEILTGGCVLANMCSSPKSPSDLEVEGSWSNVVRMYEEDIRVQ